MSNTRLGLCCVVWVAACTNEPISVGHPPCEGGELRCETPPQQVFLDPRNATQEEVRATTKVQWQKTLLPPGCMPENCLIERSQFVVHDNGEITVAALVSFFEPGAVVGRTGLWVAWLDADGQTLWESDELTPFEERRYELHSDCPPPFSSCGGVRTPRLTNFELRAGADARLIALVGQGFVQSAPAGPRGKLTGYAIEPAGGVTPALMIDSLDTFPVFSALVADDVVSAGLDLPTPTFTRHSARGELIWRRSDAIAPPPDELMIGSPFSQDRTLLQLAADSLDRVWGLLDEGGMFGFVRLEPTGQPAWRAWAWTQAFGFEVPRDPAALLSGHSELAFDGQGRALFATGELGVMRLDPNAEERTRDTPSLSVSTQEEFYSPSDVFGLDTDAQDRVYVATHEGPRSAPRLRIDRISSDFLRRESYLVDVGEIDMREKFAGLQVTPAGDVYVLIAKAVPGRYDLGALSWTGYEAQRIQLARLQLEAP